MTSATQPSLDPAASVGNSAWKSPATVILAIVSFIAAAMSGMAISGWFFKENEKLKAAAALVSSSLPLIHAQDEAEHFQQGQLSEQDQELSALKKDVDGVNAKLQDVSTRIKDSQAKLAEAEKGAGDAQARKEALIAEKGRLEKLLAEIRATEAESTKAAKAIQMASSTADPSGLSPSALADWESEWKKLADDAEKKIQAARSAHAELKKKHEAYLAGKDTFSPADKTNMISDLKRLNTETQTAMQAAREAAPKAGAALKENIDTRRKVLEDAILKAGS